MYQAKPQKDPATPAQAPEPVKADASRRGGGKGPADQKSDKIELLWVSPQSVETVVIPHLLAQPFWHEMTKVTAETLGGEVSPSLYGFMIDRIAPWVAQTFRVPVPEELEMLRSPEVAAVFARYLEANLPDFEDSDPSLPEFEGNAEEDIASNKVAATKAAKKKKKKKANQRGGRGHRAGSRAPGVKKTAAQRQRYKDEYTGHNLESR